MTPSLHRRDLLKFAAAASPTLVAGRVWAAPAVKTRLLVVFLRGAYDAANVVAPVGSDFYHQARPRRRCRPCSTSQASARR